MQYRVYKGGGLLTTVAGKSIDVTGLVPSTRYDFAVAAFNGIREGPRLTVAVTTANTRFTIPKALTVGATINLRYQEYSLGLVPIGKEPAGMFGGGNKRQLTAKVISSSGGRSVVQLVSPDNSFADGTQLTQLQDGSFGAFNGIKAIYFS